MRRRAPVSLPSPAFQPAKTRRRPGRAKQSLRNARHVEPMSVNFVRA